MKLQQTVLAYSIALALAGISGTAAASGFALATQNGSGLGNAYAGGAASAEDASTIFYNPAGMSRLSGSQLAVAAHAIKPSVKFNDITSVAAALQTKGGDGGEASKLTAVPNGYFMMEINPQMRFGLGVNAPFGSLTEYDADWVGRFQAIKTKIQTININPSISYQINDDVSVGAGLNYQQISGELTSAANWSAAIFNAGGGVSPNREGVTTVKGKDNAWGYNVGALFNVSPETRIGLAYRSAIQFNLTGTVSFTNRPAALATAVPDGPVTLAITTPDNFSASIFHKLNDKWDFMTDVNWTGWSVRKKLEVVRSNGTVLGSTQDNWRNTWRVSAGASHHYNEEWTARVGIAYDQAPTSDAFRNARTPDADRTWLAFGGQYKPTKESAVDFGYAHLFVNNAAINQTVAGRGTLIGSYSNSVDILSVQYTLGF